MRASTHHGVLAHQDDTLAAEGLPDLVHLLRADIVDGDDEDGLVIFEQALKLLEVRSFKRRQYVSTFFSFFRISLRFFYFI